MSILTKDLKTLLASLSGSLPQILAALAVSQKFLIAGMIRGWSSTGVPSMQGQDGKDYGLSYAPLSDEQISWLSGLPPLGALVGCFLQGALSNLGPKKRILLTGIGFLFSFLLLASSSITESFAAILAARAIAGISGGLSISSPQIYISECSESHIRGRLGSAGALIMALGTLVIYVVGAFLPWHHLSYFCAASTLLMLTVAWLPESPVWLLAQGKEEEAHAALKWLRKGRDIEQELDRIRENIQKAAKDSDKTGETLIVRLKSMRSSLVPLFISMGVMFFQQWCGVNVVIFYTVYIFQEAGSAVEKNMATVIVGIVQFLATFISMFLVDKAGRRILLMLSGVTMSMSLSMVGTFFYLKDQDYHQGIDFVPLLGLILFVISFSVGFASVPFVLIGELFPRHNRSLLGGISSSWAVINSFLVVKLFPNLQSLFGLAGVFWLFAAFSLLSCPFVLVFLPETKGKTLEDIETHFGRLQKHTELVAKLAAAPLSLPSGAIKNDPEKA